MQEILSVGCLVIVGQPPNFYIRLLSNDYKEAVKLHDLKTLNDRLDIIAAIAGIFLGTFIVYLYYITNLRQQDIGFVILTTSLIYLVLRNKFKKTTFTPLKISHRGKLVLNIIFFIAFSITLWIWYTQLYCRPPSYFILISLLAGIIAIEILYFKEGAPVWSILLKILLLSANIRAGIYYNFPSIMGADAYWHAKMAQLITNTGFVPPFEIIEGYFYYPIFHIVASVTQIVCQIDIKDALFCSFGLVSIISTIFIYLIGKQLAGPQVGLLATLLANVSDAIINRGITNINPGSLVLCYSLLILYLVFKEKHRVINSSLIILITLLVVISHQLSTFVCFICLASIYVGKSAYKIIYKHKESVIITTSYLLLFGVAMQSYWMHTYVHKGQNFFDWLLGPLISILRSGTEFGCEMAVTYAIYYSTLTNILFHLGYLILLFFAIGGTLFWLSSKEDKKISIVAAVIVLFIFIYAIPVFAINNMLPGRWFSFIYVFLAMLASAYIFKIIQLIKFDYNKIFAVFSIIVIISFFMLTTPNINKDNPLYAKERGSRTMFKASEISALTTINDLYSGIIKVDISYVGGIVRQMTIRSTVERFDVEYITHPDIIEEKEGTLILLRSSGFSIGHKYQSLPKEFLDKFKSTDYDLVYDNGEAWAYISK